jgi:hypothetical protein
LVTMKGGHVTCFWKAINKGFLKKNAISQPSMATKKFWLPWSNFLNCLRLGD